MSAVPIVPVSAAAWLKQIGRPWRRLTLLTGALTIADVAPAIGFAAGLALTISSLTVSPAAAAPWLALAVFSLIARGLIGQAAVIVGADRAPSLLDRPGALGALLLPEHGPAAEIGGIARWLA